MRTFFPRRNRHVSAPSAHGESTSYVIGVGSEMWSDGPADVLKIQLAYDGQVAGRKAPSFLCERDRKDSTEYHCDDFDRIAAAVDVVLQRPRTWVISWDTPKGCTDNIGKLVETAAVKAFNLPAASVERPCMQLMLIKAIRSRVQPGDEALAICTDLCDELRKSGAPRGIRLWVALAAESHATTV